MYEHATPRRVIILAAGRGARMGEATCHRHKVALPFVGRPVLERSLATLAAAGVCEVAIVTGYLGDQVADLARVCAASPALRHRMRVELVADPAPFDTLPSLRCAREFAGDCPFVVMEGSVLLSEGAFRALWAAPFDPAADAAVVGVTSAMDVAPSHSQVIVDKSGHVVALATSDALLVPAGGQRVGRLMGLTLADARLFTAPAAVRTIAQGVAALRAGATGRVRAMWDPDGSYRHFAIPEDFSRVEGYTEDDAVRR